MKKRAAFLLLLNKNIDPGPHSRRYGGNRTNGQKTAFALLRLFFIVKQGAFLSARRAGQKINSITPATASFVPGCFLLLHRTAYRKRH
ncbi:MAG: hypothetical protein Q4G07_08375 [Oscillospiraceae bacterium]|nr:hypothetical protein [Oscillospiraceae bacterium]